MCGLLLLHGPNADSRLLECLNKLRHRGPDDRVMWSLGSTSLGFTRLAINGFGNIGRQPYHHGNLTGAFNGEIYNHLELSHEHLLPSTCDTHVILPLFEIYGPRIIDRLDGFYAGVILNLESNEVFCFRDHIGKKPLFIGHSQTEMFISSEFKAFDSIDWFELLPCGVTRVNLNNGLRTTLAKHFVPRVETGVVDLFEKAVRKRMPQPHQPVGVFLSGGLDSSLVAGFVSRIRDDAVYFTLGDTDDLDQQAVKAVVDSLGLNNLHVVPLPSDEQIPSLLKAVVYATESYNPSIVSNGLATYLLANAAHEAGIKVVLTGDGADELFGGYHFFRYYDKWKETRNQLINDMHFTELRRLDMSCMAHSVEARCPFLDREIRGFSDGLDFHEMYDDLNNKVTLRRSFKGIIPQQILYRRKTSCDVGSGIRRKVVRYLRRNGRSERQELEKIWCQFFSYNPENPYFHAYPVFDVFIDNRGERHL